MSVESLPAPPAAARARRLATLAVLVVALAAATLVLLGYALRAKVLVSYPWDWSPDEALYLDYGLRFVEDPASLYARSAVPLPSAYGPLVPAAMAPLATAREPLRAARLAALAWTALAGAAVAVLLFRRAGAPWAAAGVALHFAPYDLSFWHSLVRMDAPMLALWLWAAVALLPRRLEQGADTLSAGRIAAGTVLLLASVLFKPTAVLHGAPLVLGWLLVDRRSALRLVAAVGASGLATLFALQAMTDGGFLWANQLWAQHPVMPGLLGDTLVRFGARAWPVLLMAVAAFLAARRSGGRPLREPFGLLLLGGLATVPLLGKQGAAWNYLLPLYSATVLAIGGWTALRRWWPLAGAVLALALATTRSFPLPTGTDERTARFFYAFTEEARQSAGGPVLATNPDLVYFRAGQPTEVEGTSFVHLAAAGVPGTASVLDGLRARRYALVVWTWPLPLTPEWTAALHAGYERLGECRLGWFFGAPFPSHVAVRRGTPVAFSPPPDARCSRAAAAP